MLSKNCSKILKMAEITTNLKTVQEKISQAVTKRSSEFASVEPRLVAVSKLKPVEVILEAYKAGQLNFGENYVSELVTKANNPEIIEHCPNIRWHFIGHLQKSNVNKLLSIPCLYIIETIDSEKLANTVNNSWDKNEKEKGKLKIMLQVNTSKEESKSGCAIEEITSLASHVINNCKNLEFVGLMTIGKYGYDPTDGPNPDFITLRSCRKTVCDNLNLKESDLELSMGMSTDYEHAIELGSTSVRVGSAIFGERPPKN